MKYCFALDLKDDENLIAEYENWHKAVWPEVIASIKDSGISGLEIYRIHNRLFMIMKIIENFSFDKKTDMDNANPKLQEWETMMWKYQEELPRSKPREKWILMHKIFDLNN